MYDTCAPLLPGLLHVYHALQPNEPLEMLLCAAIGYNPLTTGPVVASPLCVIQFPRVYNLV